MKLNAAGLFGAALCTVIATSARSQVATLVKDLSTTPLPRLAAGDPVAMTVSDGKAYFWYTLTESTGAELWTSDGTEAGTHLVTDILPGEVGSIADDDLYGIAPVTGGVVFPARTPYHGLELWRSDGTATGTYIIADAVPGQQNSIVNNPVSIGERAVYVSANSALGTQIFVTDGTPAGTHALTSFLPNEITGSVGRFTAAGGKAYLSIHTASTGAELWVTDGTVAGTHIVADVLPGLGSANPLGLTPSGSRLFFIATSDGSFYTPWVTDGTAAGTTQITDLVGPGEMFQLRMLAGTPTGAFLSFGIVQGNFDEELWFTDGTPAGTHQVADILPGPDDSSMPSYGLYHNGLFFFTAYDSAINYNRKVFRSDGTAEGTFAIAPAPANFANPGFFATGDRVVFQSPTATGIEPWVTDGTVAGTTPLGDFSAGADSSVIPIARSAAVSLNSTTTLFPLAVTIKGTQMPMLYRTDGTASGTLPVMPSTPVANGGSFPKQLTDVDGKLFFTQDFTVYVTDGTSEGTQSLRTFPSNVLNLVSFNGMLYFTAYDPTISNYALWKSDGTAAGTVLALPGAANAYNPRGLYPFGGFLLMSSRDPVAGYEPSITDGTVAGTRLLADLVPGSSSSDGVTYLATANGRAFFTAFSNDEGTEFYATDGTTLGTVRLTNNPGSRGSSVGTGQFYAATGNRFFFVAQNASSVRSLWVSDGTLAGTTMIAASFSAQWLTGYNGRCYFSGNYYDGSGGGIWSANEAGLSLMKPIVPVEGELYYISGMTAAGSKLYYTTYKNGLNGNNKDLRLTASDGTEAGTVEVGPIFPYQISNSLLLAAVGPDGPAYVSAYSPQAGWELYRTNGEPGVLIPVEAVPGPGSSTPISAILSGDRFYFVASSPENGRELWTVDASSLQFPPSCAADFNRDGFLDFFDYDAFVECFEIESCNGGTADFNADGFVDFFDYDDFVIAFEAGC